MTRSPATVEALLGDERAEEGKTRRRGVWLWLVDREGMDPKEEDRWWLVGSVKKMRDLVGEDLDREEIPRWEVEWRRQGGWDSCPRF